MSSFWIQLAVPVTPYPEMDQMALQLAYHDLERRVDGPITFVEHWWADPEPESPGWRLLSMQAWT